MPTQLIRSWVMDLAKKLRNSEDYDDFGYGTEPIPGDKTWVKRCSECNCRIEDKKENQ